MPTISQHSPSNFSEVLDLIENFQNANTVSWYRGVGDSKHNLLPTLFRHPQKKKDEEINILERNIRNAFSQRSPPFLDRSLTNVWDGLFFMQHYGIPTRLLDWSESPFVALYFALTGVKRNTKGKATSDAVVWMLNPVDWNQGALSDITYQGGILDQTREEVKAYSPDTDLDQRRTTPVMIYGTHNSPRIVAQRGMFALFGKGSSSMEKSYQGTAFKQNVLQKLVISKADVDGIATSLFRKGVSESTVFPDLYGLSMEIRRTFEF